MTQKLFKFGLAAIAIIFTLVFCIVVIPPFIENPDLMGAVAAGFVNPYSSGYSADAICCWAVLFVWVMYELPKVKKGWVCLLLGIIPGVAVGFALYLIVRTNQVRGQKRGLRSQM